MNPDEIKELSNNIMGCGCVMFLIPLFAILAFAGIMMIASMMGFLD